MMSAAPQEQARMWPVGEPGELTWARATLEDVNPLLAATHYLGPIRSGGARYVFAGFLDDRVVAAQVWRLPSAAYFPSDGSWLELVRWCLTPAAGKNAGSRMHGWVVRWLRAHDELVASLLSYSDPSAGHTGALYRSCNWRWRPTWHRLRPPPSGNGSWDGRTQQGVKDRWVFELRPDPARAEILAVKDDAILRRLAEEAGS